MKKSCKVQINKVFKILLLCLLIIISTQSILSKGNNDYISVTYTTYNNFNNNEEGMTTSIYNYDIRKEKFNKVYSFPYASQYPLGVYDDKDNVVYYTKRVIGEKFVGDQIFSYDLNNKIEKQLTKDLFAVNFIIPADGQILFVAADFSSPILKLGAINKKTNNISYWNNDGDTNVETIVIDSSKKQIYVSTFSYAEDRESIEKQFTNDKEEYVVPNHILFQTSYDFNKTIKLMHLDSAWIRLLVPNDEHLLVVYDHKYNDLGPSQSLYLNLMTNEYDEFELPIHKMQVGGGAFSSDKKGIYTLASINSNRGLYYYNLETKQYKPIFLPKDGFINNFQVINKP